MKSKNIVPISRYCPVCGETETKRYKTTHIHYKPNGEPVVVKLSIVAEKIHAKRIPA